MAELREDSHWELHPIGAIVHDPDLVAWPQLPFAHLLEDHLPPIVEPHDDSIAIAVVRFLDGVSGECAAKRADDGRSVVAAAASYLVADNTAREAAEDRTKTCRLVRAFAVQLDTLDHAVVDTLDDLRRARGSTCGVIEARTRCEEGGNQDGEGCKSIDHWRYSLWACDHRALHWPATPLNLGIETTIDLGRERSRAE